ncbi:MAG TPA: glycosyltransferase [Polyangiaceae bacterium]|nr:glycosyltransferase [Polyangiaceae bacterium]
MLAEATALAEAAAPAWAQAELPFVSVAVRSYRRLPQLFELVRSLQQQDYPRFEVVVIEQSTLEREAHREALRALSGDARVRILEYEALGAGAARNEAARQSRGDIVLFLDDDDLPLHDSWISAHAANYADPNCIAVSGRHVVDESIDATNYDTPKNHRLCLRYSFFKMPRGRTYHGQRLHGVTQVAGTNASIRRSAIERAGGWDDERDHDEDSFNFRFARVKAKDEYFAYDPRPAILRRLDVPGGLGRRQQSVLARLRAELRFFHSIIGRYFPWRFRAFYPVYLVLAVQRAFQHVIESRRLAPALPAPAERHAELSRTELSRY